LYIVGFDTLAAAAILSIVVPAYPCSRKISIAPSKIAVIFSDRMGGEGLEVCMNKKIKKI
jgi:hypothetical protein